MGEGSVPVMNIDARIPPPTCRHDRGLAAAPGTEAGATKNRRCKQAPDSAAQSPGLPPQTRWVFRSHHQYPSSTKLT